MAEKTVEKNARVFLEKREYEGRAYEALVLELPDTPLGSVTIPVKAKLSDADKLVIKLAK